MPDRTPCKYCGKVGFVRREQVIKAARSITSFYCGSCNRTWEESEEGSTRDGTDRPRDRKPERSWLRGAARLHRPAVIAPRAVPQNRRARALDRGLLLHGSDRAAWGANRRRCRSDRVLRHRKRDPTIPLLRLCAELFVGDSRHERGWSSTLRPCPWAGSEQTRRSCIAQPSSIRTLASRAGRSNTSPSWRPETSIPSSWSASFFVSRTFIYGTEEQQSTCPGIDGRLHRFPEKRGTRSWFGSQRGQCRSRSWDQGVGPDVWGAIDTWLRLGRHVPPHPGTRKSPGRENPVSTTCRKPAIVSVAAWPCGWSWVLMRRATRLRRRVCVDGQMVGIDGVIGRADPKASARQKHRRVAKTAQRSSRTGSRWSLGWSHYAVPDIAHG